MSAFLFPAVTYTTGLIATASFVSLGGLGDRMLLPIIVLLIIGAAVAAPNTKVSKAVAIVLLLFMAPNTEATMRDISNGRVSGFNSPYWRGRPVFAEMNNRIGPDDRVFSNCASAVLWSGCVARQVQQIPYGSCGRDSIVRLIGRDAWLLWFEPYMANTRTVLPESTDAWFDEDMVWQDSLSCDVLVHVKGVLR